MFKMRSRHIVVGTLVVLAALSLGACAKKDGESKTNTAPPAQADGPAAKAGNSSSSTTAPAPPAVPAIAGAPYILWLAGGTVLLPALNSLQRGQVDILLLFCLLLGL